MLEAVSAIVTTLHDVYRNPWNDNASAPGHKGHNELRVLGVDGSGSVPELIRAPSPNCYFIRPGSQREIAGM